VDFVVLPPGHGSSVADFWGWDAHEAQLRCPDDVSGDIGGWSARRALKSKFYQPTQTMVTAGILPFRENSDGRPGNRTRDLMISGQRLRPLDHEAVLFCQYKVYNFTPFNIILYIISIIIIIIFMQGIYTYIPETNYVPREYSVAAILLLLFKVLISLVPVSHLSYFYITTFRSMGTAVAQ